MLVELLQLCGEDIPKEAAELVLINSLLIM